MSDAHMQTEGASVRRDYRTMYDLVFHSLLEDILSGRIKPGEKLNISEISERLGVSRTPIREALKQLVSAGLVDSEPHRSPFVKKLSIEEIIELYCVRAALDGIASRLAARRLSDEQIGALTRLCDHMESVAEASRLAEFLADNDRFHAIICDASGSARIQELSRQYYRQAEQYRNLVLDLPGSYEALCQEHRRILGALSQRDSDAADEATRLHYFNSARRIAQSVGTSVQI